MCSTCFNPDNLNNLKVNMLAKFDLTWHYCGKIKLIGFMNFNLIA